MNSPFRYQDPQIIRPGDSSHSELGPADPRQLAMAAEELRDRTMQLEEAPIFPSFAFVLTTLLMVLAASALVLLFRAELRAMFKLTGF